MRTAADALLAFLPGFETPGRAFTERWVSTAGTFPYPVYTDDVVAFFTAAGRDCWADYAYEPRLAAAMLSDDTAIDRATLDEIRTMLTYCVRGERFCDGHWEHVLKTGRVQRLLRRLRALREAGEIPAN